MEGLGSARLCTRRLQIYLGSGRARRGEGSTRADRCRCCGRGWRSSGVAEEKRGGARQEEEVRGGGGGPTEWSMEEGSGSVEKRRRRGGGAMAWTLEEIKRIPV
ncbi:hypothetical protein PR202_ga24267 [Eleusine coracana subsp. coracana]|uniref:Uncharacterized protein n=1 Tax=Eleusine coracana subsp. coracana TaxID=191504 RepID=A0AAV5D8E7_ELECO|nr:hypothetical protein PR202_ga24267 [Eleusine coracana subsp. coracana]